MNDLLAYRSVSSELVEIINESFKEIILEGAPYDQRKKWIIRYLQLEGIDATAFESSFLGLIAEFEKKSVDMTKIRKLADSCYITPQTVDALYAALTVNHKKKEKKDSLHNTLHQKWTPIPTHPYLVFKPLEANLFDVAVSFRKDAGYPPSGELDIPASFHYEDLVFTITTITDRAFEECAWMLAANIPASIRTIGENAFFGCRNLGRIDFEGRSVHVRCNSFDDTPFSESRLNNFISDGIVIVDVNNCPTLVPLDNENKKYTSPDYPYLEFELLAGLKGGNPSVLVRQRQGEGFRLPHHLSIPPRVVIEAMLFDVKTIDGFKDCDCIQSVEFISSDLVVNKRSFQRCSNLSSVIFKSAYQLTIHEGAFSKCMKLTSLAFNGPYARRDISPLAFTSCPLPSKKRAELIKYLIKSY